MSDEFVLGVIMGILLGYAVAWFVRAGRALIQRIWNIDEFALQPLTLIDGFGEDCPQCDGWIGKENECQYCGWPVTEAARAHG